ncbi:MAG: LruC domain-containing protein [Bacteroidales bacterium]|nr:LruC domain-containing protein [Bacteroidales bacterium]
MKQSSLTIFFAALMTALFCACSDDFGSKDIPQEELYTRAFIKEFGVFDMAHTWNLATEGTITVTPTSYINECKVYARYEGEYYYVARAINAYKEFTLTFDIPSGVTDLKLLIDGTTYYAQVGTRLQASGRGSRTMHSDADATDAVKIIDLTEWETYSEEYAISYRNTVPEGWDNRFKEGITQDFLFTSNLDDKGEPVVTTLYPVYWQTSQTHTIGVYYYPDNDETQKMVTVPLYTSKSGSNDDTPIEETTGDIQYRSLTKSSEVTVNSTEEWVTALGITYFTTSEVTEESTDRSKLELNDDQLQSIFNHVKANNKVVEYSNEYAIEKVYFKSVQHTDDGDILTLTCRGVWDEWKYVGSNGTSPSYQGEGTQYRSKGIQFTVDAGIRFGMYSSSGAGTFFSQRHLNEANYCVNHGYTPPNTTKDPVSVINTNGASHAATFYGEYTGWLYLCFEDWPDESRNSDMDLNDMVCRITPTTLTTTTTTEVELETKSFTWLIAAEDLGTTDDFDFNDMVVAVSSLPTTDVQTDQTFSIVQFKALAAGGTLPLYLHLVDKQLYIRENSSSTYVSSCTRSTSNGKNDFVLFPDNINPNSITAIESMDVSKAEWHKWFGNGEYSSSTMINTESGYTVEGMTSTVYLNGTYTITQYGNVENNTIEGFCITVNGYDLESNNTDPNSSDKEKRKLTPPEKGSAPQMFVILDQGDLSDNPKGWRWPKERCDIMDAYQYFQPWAADHTSNTDWHKNPNEGEVISARKSTFISEYLVSSFALVTEGTSVWGYPVNVYSLKFSTDAWDSCTGIKVTTTATSPDIGIFSDSSCNNYILSSNIKSTTIPKSSISMPTATDGMYTLYLVDFGGGYTSAAVLSGAILY